MPFEYNRLIEALTNLRSDPTEEGLEAADVLHKEFIEYIHGIPVPQRQELYSLKLKRGSEGHTRALAYSQMVAGACDRVVGPPVMARLHDWLEAERGRQLGTFDPTFLFDYDSYGTSLHTLLDSFRDRHLEEGADPGEDLQACCQRIREMGELGYDFDYDVIDEDNGMGARQNATSLAATMGVPAITQALIEAGVQFDPYNRNTQVRPAILDAVAELNYHHALGDAVDHYPGVDFEQNFEIIADEYHKQEPHRGALVTRKFYWNWTDDDFQGEDDDGNPMEPEDEEHDETLMEFCRYYSPYARNIIRVYFAKRYSESQTVTLLFGWRLSWLKLNPMPAELLDDGGQDA